MLFHLSWRRIALNTEYIYKLIVSNCKTSCVLKIFLTTVSTVEGNMTLIINGLALSFELQLIKFYAASNSHVSHIFSAYMFLTCCLLWGSKVACAWYYLTCYFTIFGISPQNIILPWNILNSIPELSRKWWVSAEKMSAWHTTEADNVRNSGFLLIAEVILSMLAFAAWLHFQFPFMQVGEVE